MNEFAARIKRVQMKSGGADVRIIPGSPLQEEMMDLRGDLLCAAKEIVSRSDGLTGYVVVALEPDGSHHFCHRFTEECAVPRTLWPAYIAEIVRRSAIVGFEAQSTFDNMFQWQDG